MEEYLWALVVPGAAWFLSRNYIQKDGEATKFALAFGMFFLCLIVFCGGLIVGQKMEIREIREAFKKNCQCNNYGCRCFFPKTDDSFKSPSNDSLHPRVD